MDTERRIKELAESTLRLEKNEGEDKVISLREAIKRNVKTGMVLHITSSAALSEILRQYWGTKPEFTLIAPPLPLGWNIVHAGLAKKIIFCNTGRSDVFNRAYREKKVNFEIWSFAGISQRLLAGALGTGFIPTKSLIGTTMAEENKDSFQVISDPFGCGKKVGIIKALNPDLTILHGWAADSDGNTILPVGPTPYGSAVDDWSALASKNDVVVTVEKLVSTAFIREHSSMVRIPGYRVNSVSVVPFGAHPGCIHGCGNIKEFEAYDEDSEFLTKYQEAAKNPQSLDAWIKQWVLDCPSHEDYLRKLGNDRIQTLKRKGRGNILKYQLPFMIEKVSTSIEFSETEMMIVAASRKIKERILKGGHKVVLCGMGIADLATWLPYYQLKAEGHPVNLMSGIGLYGFAPWPRDPSLAILPNLQTCKIISNVAWAYNLILTGENRRSISILGAFQVDKFGNLNSGRISNELFGEGPGGAGDAFQSCETVAIIGQSKARFVERAPYITVPGANVKTLVSTLGIFEKLGDDEEFSLTACLPNSNFPTMNEKIENVKTHCSWELKVAPKIEEIFPPTFEELMTLRLIDPNGLSRN